MAEEVSFAHGVNDFVVLQGLQAQTEYNDKVAVVKDLLREKSRLAVRLVGLDKTLNVKDSNLRAPSEEELKVQLPAAFQKFRADQIEAMLSAKGAAVPAGGDKDKLIEAAVAAKVVPEVVKKRFDPDELIDVPGGGKMTRAQMLEQARQLESMSPTQMREQLRILTSRSPGDLRAQIPQMRDMTDDQIQSQIKQLQLFVNNPRLKKAQIEALKTGDFSKLNEQAVHLMSDREIRENAKKQLEEFRKDPAAFRKQFFPDQESLSDADIEELLKQQSEVDGETLRTMRAATSGSGNMDLSKLSEEQWKKQAELQLKMFKANPKKFREQMERQTPEAKNLADDQIEMQLETMAKMSKAEFEQMQQMASGMKAGGGAGGATAVNPADMEKMSGDQLKTMFKMQSDMFKRDPARFKQMVPQMAGLSDDMIQGQLDMMADMDPTMLKMLVAFQSRFGNVYNAIKGPLDKVSGGRGQQIIGVLMMTVLFLIVYYLMTLLFRLLAFLFPTTFGFTQGAKVPLQEAASAAAAAQAGAAGGAAPQVDLNVDEDAFFQDNEDL